MIKIIPATVNDARIIHELAHAIWYPTYKDVISLDQIEFMLEKSYTEEALIAAMEADVSFYILLERGFPVGFMSLEPQKECLRIGKLYLLPNTQGKGYGKVFIDFAAEQALKAGNTALELNVNRNNPAYGFYLKQDFEVVESVDIPYYQYVLNDYVMRKPLHP